MKSSTRDKAEGTAQIVKGKAKVVAGKAAAKPRLRDEGRADQARGRAQKKVGDIKKVFGR